LAYDTARGRWRHKKKPLKMPRRRNPTKPPLEIRQPPNPRFREVISPVFFLQAESRGSFTASVRENFLEATENSTNPFVKFPGSPQEVSTN
jgi:hypothetical protein